MRPTPQIVISAVFVGLVANGILPTATIAEVVATSRQQFRKYYIPLAHATRDFDEVAISVSHTKLGLERFRLRAKRGRFRRTAFGLWVILAALALTFLVLQCFRHLSSGFLASSRRRSLAEGSPNECGNGEQDPEGDDDDDGNGAGDAMGQGSRRWRPPLGPMGRMLWDGSTGFFNLFRALFGSGEGRPQSTTNGEGLQLVTVQQPAADVRPQQRRRMEIAGGRNIPHFSLLVGLWRIGSALLFASGLARADVTRFGIFRGTLGLLINLLLAIEQLVFAATRGQIDLMERFMRTVMPYTPPSPTLVMPASILLNYGLSTLTGGVTGGLAVAENFTGFWDWSILLSNVLIIMIGVEELILTLTNGHADITQLLIGPSLPGPPAAPGPPYPIERPSPHLALRWSLEFFASFVGMFHSTAIARPGLSRGLHLALATVFLAHAIEQIIVAFTRSRVELYARAMSPLFRRRPLPPSAIIGRTDMFRIGTFRALLGLVLLSDLFGTAINAPAVFIGMSAVIFIITGVECLIFVFSNGYVNIAHMVTGNILPERTGPEIIELLEVGEHGPEASEPSAPLAIRYDCASCGNNEEGDGDKVHGITKSDSTGDDGTEEGVSGEEETTGSGPPSDGEGRGEGDEPQGMTESDFTSDEDGEGGV